MKKRNVRNKKIISGMLEGQGIGKESSIFVVGNREVSVCGCKKVVSYSYEFVRLASCDGVIDIYGAELEVASCFGSEIKLSGRIHKISFSESEEE